MSWDLTDCKWCGRMITQRDNGVWEHYETGQTQCGLPVAPRDTDARVRGSDMKLNLGCGTTPLEGWWNIDLAGGPGVMPLDLDDPLLRLPFDDDSCSQVYGSHIFEHLHNPLRLMEELWRVCEPDAEACFRTPYGSSDDADEDPTHVRRMFVKSWAFYGQPSYYRSSPYNGYRGDWHPYRIELLVDPTHSALCELAIDEMWDKLQRERNVVREMVAHLRCIKPARENKPEAHLPMEVVFCPIEREGDPLEAAQDALGLGAQS